MTDRSTIPDARLAARLKLAAAALWWERIWPACWPALAVLGAFVVVALFDLLPSLGGRWHAACLLGFGAALILAVRSAAHGFLPPGPAAARRRIERMSGLAHRPLAALSDRPAAPLDPAAVRLWDAHRQRMRAAARRLRVGWPQAGLAPRDPWGLRAVMAILLLLGVVDAGGQWHDRLWRALTPTLDGPAPAIAASLDVWVTPPDYTGLAPIFLRADTKQPVAIPTGSMLLARLHGGDGVPQLVVDGRTQNFKRIDAENFQLATKLARGRRLEVEQAGAALGSWAIEIIPDRPPIVAFAAPPAPTAQGALAIAYRASDDYGVENVKAVITRLGGLPSGRLALDLPLPGLHMKRLAATSYQDLTANPWAGLPVEMRLVASDGAGQRGESRPERLVLPERTFRNPVARAIIDERKALVKDPASRRAVADILGDLHFETHRYGDDAAAFLDLRVAQESLRLGGRDHRLAEVEALLWDTALRIENGHAPLALQEVRRLEEKLRQALAKGAPNQEINRLTAELQQALDRYLEALARNLAGRPPAPTPGRAQAVSRSDLQHMIDEVRELAHAGARQQAQALLAQLEGMLENLRAMGSQPLSPGAREAQQMMRGMRELMQRQQQLLDRSFRAEEEREPDGMRSGGQPDGIAPDGKAGLGDAAQQQESLRRALGEMMRRLGEGSGDIPDPLGRAERAMKEAAGALQAGQPGDAIGPQTSALDELRQAASQIARQMQRQLGRGVDDRLGAAAGGPEEETQRDPLGRPLPTSGAYDEGDVKIPAWNTLERSRAILDELRRRAGESGRPALELQYIDRLLRQF